MLVSHENAVGLRAEKNLIIFAPTLMGEGPGKG
jgi:hypothetical protein